MRESLLWWPSAHHMALLCAGSGPEGAERPARVAGCSGADEGGRVGQGIRQRARRVQVALPPGQAADVWRPGRWRWHRPLHHPWPSPQRCERCADIAALPASVLFWQGAADLMDTGATNACAAVSQVHHRERCGSVMCQHPAVRCAGRLRRHVDGNSVHTSAAMPGHGCNLIAADSELA